MSSINVHLPTLRTARRAATTVMAANARAVCAAAADETVTTGVQGTPNTNAATRPNRGESATPSAMPAISDTMPTEALSSASTHETRACPMPSSSYRPNSRLRRRTKNTLAYPMRNAKITATNTANATSTSPDLA